MKEYCSICGSEVYEDDRSVDIRPPVGLTEKAHRDCAQGMKHEITEALKESQ